jgi:hypothetical protein
VAATILFFLMAMLTEAITKVPADMEHINFFCFGTMSHLYDKTHHIYMATSEMQTCEGLEAQKNIDPKGYKLLSKFDNSTLDCKLFSTKVYCNQKKGKDEKFPSAEYLASKDRNHIKDNLKLVAWNWWNNCGITMVVILGLNILSFLVIWGIHFAKSMGAEPFEWGKVLESTRKRVGENKWNNSHHRHGGSSQEVQDKDQ